MKYSHSFIALAILSLIACENKVEDDRDKKTPSRQLYCEFYPVDCFKTKLALVGISPAGYALSLEMINSSSDFLSTCRFNDESIKEKEKTLAKEMTDWSYHLFRWDGKPEVHYKMIYGGVSDQVRIFSSEEFAGKTSGENLEELFMVWSEGMVKYPEMTIVPDIQRPMGVQIELYNLLYSLDEYFINGMVLCGIDEKFYIKPRYDLSVSEYPSFTIEIPVTGLDSNGEETTVVFTAELPAVPAS